MKRVHLHVSGRVQGVFFRAECERMARARSLGGFVRNMPDGRVEAAFEGDDADVDAAVVWCRQGPPWAAVDSVEATAEQLTGEREFRVR